MWIHSVNRIASTCVTWVHECAVPITIVIFIIIYGVLPRHGKPFKNFCVDWRRWNTAHNRTTLDAKKRKEKRRNNYADKCTWPSTSQTLCNAHKMNTNWKHLNMYETASYSKWLVVSMYYMFRRTPLAFDTIQRSHIICMKHEVWVDIHCIQIHSSRAHAFKTYTCATNAIVIIHITKLWTFVSYQMQVLQGHRA